MFQHIVRIGHELRGALAEAGFFVSLALRSLKFWHRDPPVRNVADLVRFVETRAKFVAQITLFGYLKTRMGTRYTQMFVDETYARSVNIAKWEIYLSCLGDAAAFAVARTGRDGQGTDAEMCAIALHVLNTILDGEDVPDVRPQGFNDIRTAFDTRARTLPWRECAEGETAFRGSLEALMYWAPIADELKERDTPFVRNSMRFKWKKVRDDIESLLDADAVLADWRNGKADPVPPAPLTARHRPQE